MWKARTSSILAWLRPSPLLVILLLNLLFAASNLADESRPGNELSLTGVDGQRIDERHPVPDRDLDEGQAREVRLLAVELGVDVVGVVVQRVCDEVNKGRFVVDPFVGRGG